MTVEMPKISVVDMVVLVENEIECLKGIVGRIEHASAYVSNRALGDRLSVIQGTVERVRELLEYIDANLPKEA